MFNWEEHLTEIQEGEDYLENMREVVDKEEESSVISLLKEKNQEIKNWEVRIKKLSKNLNESEAGEFIIDRSKSLKKLITK